MNLTEQEQKQLKELIDFLKSHPLVQTQNT